MGESSKRKRGQSMVQTTPTYNCVTPVTTRVATPKVHGENRARTHNRVNTRCAFSAAQGSRHNGHEIRKRGRLRIIGRSVCVASNREVNPLSPCESPLSAPFVYTHAYHPPPPPSMVASFAQCALQRSHRWREWKSRSLAENIDDAIIRARHLCVAARSYTYALVHVRIDKKPIFFLLKREKKIGPSLLDFIGMRRPGFTWSNSQCETGNRISITIARSVFFAYEWYACNIDKTCDIHFRVFEIRRQSENLVRELQTSLFFVRSGRVRTQRAHYLWDYRRLWETWSRYQVARSQGLLVYQA